MMHSCEPCRSRANLLDCPPDACFDCSAEAHGIEPLPGRALVSMAVRPKTKAGILLPDREQAVCDIGLVLAGGGNLCAPGDWVVVRPYTGLVLEGGLRLLGAGRDTLDWVLPARWSPDGLHPMPGWHWAEAVPGEGQVVRLSPAKWRCQGRALGLDALWADMKRPPWDSGFESALCVQGGPDHGRWLVRSRQGARP